MDWKSDWLLNGRVVQNRGGFHPTWTFGTIKKVGKTQIRVLMDGPGEAEEPYTIRGYKVGESGFKSPRFIRMITAEEEAEILQEEKTEKFRRESIHRLRDTVWYEQPDEVLAAVIEALDKTQGAVKE
jgi:hypothetical protein